MYKKIPQIILFVLFSFFVLPNLAFASWWNPFSWAFFNKSAKTKITQIATSTATTTKNQDESIISGNSASTSTKSNTIVKIPQAPKIKEDIKEIDKLVTPPVKPTPKPLVLEKPVVPSCDQSYIDKLVNERYQQEEAKRIKAKAVEDERIRQADIEAQRLAEEKKQEEQRLIVAKKVIYQKPIVPTTPNTPPVTPETTYSDYNFNYIWDNNILSCPMTPRNIVIKKAVFKVSESELQKIDMLRSIESDGFRVYIFNPQLVPNSGVNSRTNSVFNLEKRDQNTYVYFGGAIPVCGDGSRVSLNYSGVLTDTTTGGRNLREYLSQKGISVEVSDGSGGNPAVTPGSANAMFTIQITPSMSEWELWDNTTNKPVEIN